MQIKQSESPGAKHLEPSAIKQTQFFGDFDQELTPSQEYLVINFSPSSVPLQQRWRNNGLSADFLADYILTFLPRNEEDPSTHHRQVEIRSAVSYIANELLENAMKFNHEPSHHVVGIQLHLYSDRLVFTVSNSLDPARVEGFQSFLQELSLQDPNDLYLERLEQNAISDHPDDSGLGLLTMMNDYGAKLGWKFVTLDQDPQVTIVTTMVQLSL